MTPERLAVILVRAGASIGRTRTGALVVANVPPELRVSTYAHAAELALLVAGRTTGNRWRRCDQCHRPRLCLSVDQSCRLTPRCGGKTRNEPPPQPLAEGVGCARPGCTNPAEHITYWHEPLCGPDFTHLALALDHRSTTPVNHNPVCPVCDAVCKVESWLEVSTSDTGGMTLERIPATYNCPFADHPDHRSGAHV